MIPAAVALLACPHCGRELSAVDGALRCPAGHSYDVARQGYVTLGRAAGDSADMVAARAEFLAAGHFAPLSGLLAGAARGTVLDVGAGTGEHLAAVLDAAGTVGVALDASRYAARRAARAHPRIGAVVADAWAGLPVRDGVIDTVLDVFSPRNGPETARVLSPGGTLLVVTPGPDHLAGLVDAVGGLSVDPRKDDRLAAGLEPHLTPLERSAHRWELRLPHRDALAAVAMGPSARHLADLPARVAALPDPVVTVASVTLTRYGRPPAA